MHDYCVCSTSTARHVAMRCMDGRPCPPQTGASARTVPRDPAEKGPAMPSTAIHDWGDALKTAVANALSLFFGAIPKVLAFAVIVLIGWLIAAALAKVVRALLEK